MDARFTDLEIFHDGKSQDLFIHDMKCGQMKKFSPDMTEFIAQAFDDIKERYPSVIKVLLPSDIHGKNYKYNVVNRFFRCNFFVNDHVADIDDNGIFHLEVVPCPLRGICPDENKVCKPILNTALSSRELEIAILLAQGKSKTEVADELFISVFTVETHRKNIYAKLRLHSLNELTLYLTINKLMQ